MVGLWVGRGICVEIAVGTSWWVIPLIIIIMKSLERRI
ncbi:hypothetical protein LD85_0561 [Saccharolobus islandicus L.D.8.5]|uniref:Uncharacterized protein n=1 Tax=Saccharolobus islandicus (strain L.D.8.5 / Lassen \|nr:hypothetical protein LD85_0561 [Sulfolobus islandicus L.D.8.5]